MSKIEQNREAKRHAILSAAKDTFLADGYEAASMDEIASLAKVTKQTVYRYYPSKIELFEATIRFVGQSSEANFARHLDNSNTKDALGQFAEGFIRWHLEKEHISVFRLLVAESAKSPEIVQSFFSVAPDETNAALSEFFSDRLGVSQPEDTIRLWVSMLLAYRDEVLLGMGRPDARTISQYSERATRFLLAGLDQL
jgi:TetR/AcrR family transcriptional regulator of autoinduction and epiphytic fitness